MERHLKTSLYTASLSFFMSGSLALVASACGNDDTSGQTGGAGSTTRASSAVASGSGSSGGGGGDACPPPRAWYEFGLDPVLNSIVLHYLGQTWDQSADVGEVLETATRIDPAVEHDWLNEWRVTADRLVAVGRAAEADGHAISASHAYLRGATYYRAALHHQDDPHAPVVKELAEAEVASFEKYLTLSGSPCAPVDIPYESTTLPGYFCRSPIATGPAPTLIFQEGRDAWAEDGKFIADEALKRGYHTLMFDGPGMAKVIRIQGLPFRHDWENVLTPVIDFTVARPEVDASRLGLISVSMGGYMGPRAAAFDHRLKVMVANPGVLRWSDIFEGYLQALDPELLPLLDTDEAAFDARMRQYMQASDFFNWGVVDFMWHHGVDTPSALVKDLRKYTLADVVDQITAHTLVIDAEAEEWGQSQLLFDALTCPKDYLMLTAEETAQFHVQPGARAIFSQRMFDWIDEHL